MKKKSVVILLVSIILYVVFIGKINLSNFSSYFLSKTNPHFEDGSQISLFGGFLDLLSLDIDNPISLLDDKLVTKEVINFEEPMFVYINNQNIVKDPVVYIYSSHPIEYYADESLTEYNLKPGVLTASYLLQEKLNSMGINTIVEEKNVYNYLIENNLSYDDSYDVSRSYVEEAINKYSTLELIIDLHRDAIPYDSAVTTINEIEYARTMFVMSEEISNIERAYEFNEIIEEKYPSLSRGVYKKTYHFNQDLFDELFLLELGSNNNTYEQVKNSVEALSLLIEEYLNER